VVDVQRTERATTQHTENPPQSGSGLSILLNLFANFPHHRGQVLHHIIIPKADYPQPQLTQHLLSPFIFLFLQIVDIPIRVRVHNQPRPVTVKIDDESLNDLLPPKMDAQIIRP